MPSFRFCRQKRNEGDGIDEGAHSLAWTLHCNVCDSDLFDNQEHLAFCICHSIVRLRVEPRSASVVRVVRVVLALDVSNVRACCQSSHASIDIRMCLYAHVSIDIRMSMYVYMYEYIFIYTCEYMNECVHARARWRAHTSGL